MMALAYLGLSVGFVLRLVNFVFGVLVCDSLAIEVISELVDRVLKGQDLLMGVLNRAPVLDRLIFKVVTVIPNPVEFLLGQIMTHRFLL